MSNDLINVRIGLWHFQLSRNGVRVTKNIAHIGYPYGFFAVYSFFGMR